MERVEFTKRKVSETTIYGYTLPYKTHKGLIKIGYTTRNVNKRIEEQLDSISKKTYKIVLREVAMRNDGTHFKDTDVHTRLKRLGIKQVKDEWFKCKADDVKSVIISLRNKEEYELIRTKSFRLRPEQNNAVEITSKFFTRNSANKNDDKVPHFLWNCKMRFGKTFTAYKLAQKMGWKKLLILTFKPAVEDSWKDDLLTHIDFEGWQFISNQKDEVKIENVDRSKPFVWFGSFQDFLGKNDVGGIKGKNKEAHLINWDCIILDEYHFGAWRDSSKELYQNEDGLSEKKYLGVENMELWNDNTIPITTNHFLYLSGTPFKAIASGEFLEDQIFNWTYSDEQEAKQSWVGENNPYLSLPQMVMMVYKLPEDIAKFTDKGEFDEFDLNVFFSAEGEFDKARFKHDKFVQNWLNLIRGAGFSNFYNNLKLEDKKPKLPFSDTYLLNILTHTFWFLPSVSSCYAMKNLLQQNQNSFYHSYKVIVCAGTKAGVGLKALKPVRNAMGNPLITKTITLSCGKLTTGVTVRPWSGIFMLRNTGTPETYFQTAFRVQSPWTISSDRDKTKSEILKNKCFIFDFAPNRALKLVTSYSTGLNLSEINPEKKVSEFINFLPIISFDGSSMRQISARDVLDISMVGTSGSQLAKKFESRRLVNVDNDTLQRLFDDNELLESLMKLETFRSLNTDLEKIINLSKINRGNRGRGNKINGRTLSADEKQEKSRRDQIREKLQKFATRIPIFMYLSEYREKTLIEIIQNLETDLFRRVTNLTIEDFKSLVELEVFNSALMNEAVFAFKRYEDPSLFYAGKEVSKHYYDEIGGFDKTISAEEYYGTEDI